VDYDDYAHETVLSVKEDGAWRVDLKSMAKLAPDETGPPNTRLTP